MCMRMPFVSTRRCLSSAMMPPTGIDDSLRTRHRSLYAAGDLRNLVHVLRDAICSYRLKTSLVVRRLIASVSAADSKEASSRFPSQHAASTPFRETVAQPVTLASLHTHETFDCAEQFRGAVANTFAEDELHIANVGNICRGITADDDQVRLLAFCDCSDPIALAEHLDAILGCDMNRFIRTGDRMHLRKSERVRFQVWRSQKYVRPGALARVDGGLDREVGLRKHASARPQGGHARSEIHQRKRNRLLHDQNLLWRLSGVEFG